MASNVKRSAYVARPYHFGLVNLRRVIYMNALNHKDVHELLKVQLKEVHFSMVFNTLLLGNG